MRLPCCSAVNGSALLLASALALSGCAKKIPPEAPPSPPVDLTVHNATRAVVTDTVPEPELGSAEGLVLADATDVVVVQVRRIVELKLNPLLLALARKYVEDDCLLSGLLGVEKVMVSHGPSGWVAAADGDDLSKTVLECLAEGSADQVQTFRGHPSAPLFESLRAVDRDGALLVGEDAALRRVLGPQPTKGAGRALVGLLPNRDDTLLEVSSRSPIEGAASESVGYLSGDLDRLELHSESRVQDEELAKLAKMFPVLKMAIRPAVEKMIGEGPEADLLVGLLEKLEVEQKGDRIIVDLAVDDPVGLFESLTHSDVGAMVGKAPASRKGSTP